MGNASWDLEEVGKLAAERDVLFIRSDMCRFDLRVVKGPEGPLSQKMEGLLTNSEELAVMLDRRCICVEPHAHLLNGSAKKTEVYTKEFCTAILKGLKAQLEADGTWLDLSEELEEMAFFELNYPELEPIPEDDPTMLEAGELPDRFHWTGHYGNADQKPTGRTPEGSQEHGAPKNNGLSPTPQDRRLQTGSQALGPETLSLSRV